ncbi:AAA family ATPase [Corallococcus carmarthensis]|nr:AAA family ATPase [Corallococcus carmarthensis]NOK23136.1 AAA family ATPase [Corallococcus carmarthensis]
MIESITLRNFKSFGEEQTIPLEPITVLVGPNNSGKSNFMSVARFLSNAVTAGLTAAIDQEGEVFFRRPDAGPQPCHIAWAASRSTYAIGLSPNTNKPLLEEKFNNQDDALNFNRLKGNRLSNPAISTPLAGPPPLDGNTFIFQHRNMMTSKQHAEVDQLSIPFAGSKTIKLSISTLRSDAEVVPSPEIGLDGRGIAAVLGLWRGAMPEKAEALNKFLSQCLPEIVDVLVRPAPVPGFQRLWFRQKDGLEFDAAHVSDGVLVFTALVMLSLSVEPGQLLCIEEPEQSIHPKRLRELVDLLKDIVRERQCQFIIATHSTVLLNAFRDELEAVLLFRRSDTGTRVKRLSDVPELVEALQQAPPGDLLETGAFSTAF